MAKLQLLPTSHPVRRLVQIADQLPCDSWVRSVRHAMADPRLSSAIVDIHSSDIAPADIMTLALVDPAVRRNVLRKYKLDIVRPLLQEIDGKQFEKDAGRYLPAFDCLYSDLSSDHGRLMVVLLNRDIPWRLLRLWLLVRLTGQWPVSMYVPGPLLNELPMCRACGQEHILVSHVLGSCAALPSAPRTAAATLELFSHSCEAEALQSHILFVGLRVHEALAATFWEETNGLQDVDGRVEAWLSDFAQQVDSE
jgi:hypothetical protein